MITQAPRGTSDWFGDKMRTRTQVEAMARNLCEKFNIKEVITPVFEHTVLFQRGVGETTDVVQKEMYTFVDKGGRSITLKPEGTSGAIRAYVENKLYAEPQPVKMFYITPAFRYEKPESGRLRQHHQFGVEFVGSPNPMAEVEVMTLVSTLIRQIGLSDAKLHINSIGCPECRKKYNAALREYLKANEDKLCDTCKKRMVNNPLRVLDCKSPECKEVVKAAPRIIDYICDDCRAHMNKLCELLDKGGIKYAIDPNIVRGLDYYTKTVFEFVTNALGSQGTVCGGGRYNNLVESVGGKPTPCVGFGMGIERLLMLMKACGVEIADNNHPDVFVASQSPEYMDKCLEIVTELRQKGIAAETDLTGKSLKSQMKYADKIKSDYVVVLGGNEIESGECVAKRMSDGEKINVKINQIDSVCRR